MMRARLLAVAALGFLLAACGGKKLHPYQEAVERKPDPEIGVMEGLSTLWKVDVGGGDRIGYTSIRPAVSDDAVFFADPDGDVVRIDIEDGSLGWKVKASSDINAGTGSDGSLVAVGLVSGSVAVFDAGTGEPLWEKEIDLEVSAPPLGAAGVVAVRTSDGTVMGLDAADGEEHWRFQRTVPGLTLRGDAPMVALGTGLLTGFANGKLVASDLVTGRVFWEKIVSLARGRNEIERLNDADAPPLVAGRDIYAATYGGTILAIRAEDASDRWVAKVSTRRPMDADRHLLFVTDDRGTVIALDRGSGQEVWRQDALQGHGVSGPVLFDIYLVVGTLDGDLYFLDPDDGTLAGRYPAVDGAVIAMEASGDRLLVASSAGEIAAVSFTY